MDKHLYSIYQFFQKNKVLFWVGTFAIFGLLGAVALQISFEEDISKLIPKTTENQRLQQVLETANFSDKIIVHLEREENGSLEELIEAATLVTERLQADFNTEIRDIQGVIEDETALETIDFVQEHLPVFLSEANYTTIAQKLHADSIDAITKSNYEVLRSPTGLVAKRNMPKDPLGITYMGLQRLQELGANNDFEIREGFLVSKDDKHLLLFLTPQHSSSETALNKGFVEKLYRLQADVAQQFESKVALSLFGGVLIAVSNAEQIKNDIQYTVGISSIVLMLLLILFYRKITVPLILFVPTIFGAVLAVAFLTLVKGEISAISLGIGSILLGVTFDYSLHILTHLRNGSAPKLVFRSVAKPVLMSSLSTAVAFLCLLFLEAEALQDLGLFAAISVLGAAVFALIFVPQLYASRKIQHQKYNLLDAMAKVPVHTNKVVWSVQGVLIVVSLFSVSNVKFNKELESLNYISNPLLQAEKKLDTLLDSAAKSIYVVATGKDLQEALQANDTVLTALQHLKQNEAILRYNSVGGMVSSEQKQQQRIQRWKEFWTDSRVDSLRKNLALSSATYGFTENAFQPFFGTLTTSYDVVPPSEYDALGVLNTGDFISESAGLTTITTLVKLEEAQVEELKASFTTLDGVMVIDRVGINETLLGQLKDQFYTLMLYSFLAVFVMLLLFYRNLMETVVT
ncbi:MAG: MMPL family transporter, partial [Marinirhabdus sp.]|nr:MMPL family transporter [Marinirhabdus sp.]